MVLPMPRPQKHKKTGVYYFRQRVPADLVKAVGRSEVVFSLKTKDPAAAKDRYAAELAKLTLRWKALRTRPEPVPHIQLVALAGDLYRQMISLHVSEPGEPGLWIELLALLDRLEANETAIESWYGPTADDLLQKHGIAADVASRSRLIAEAHSALRQAANHLLKKSRGDYRPDPDADRFPTLSPSPNEGYGITISRLFDLWERDHLADGKSARTPRDHRQKVEDFIAFLGHNDATGVKPQDVSRWTEHLRHDRKLSAKTVSDKYLSAVRAVFGKGLDKFLIENNPAAPVTVRIPKRAVTRPKGFTDDEAKRVLQAALSAVDAPGNTSGRNRLAFRWLPWICAYTGARGGEIAQLRKEDFVTEYEIPCIRITPEAGTVKSQEYRIVPIHPHLVEQGLLKFVEGAAEGPLFYKPSGKKRKAGTSQASGVVGKVSKWVRDVAKITDARVQPNHGWRHRFKTIARDEDIAPRYMDALQGHADGSASANYGENTVKALYREIQKLPEYRWKD